MSATDLRMGFRRCSSSYAHMIMVIHFLQRKHIVPNLQVPLVGVGYRGPHSRALDWRKQSP